jgi:transcriptional regulator with XRE-family HTH domain
MAERRCTQQRIADRLGVSQAAVSRRLMGDVEFTVGELAAVAEVLGVHVAELLPEAVA